MRIFFCYFLSSLLFLLSFSLVVFFHSISIFITSSGHAVQIRFLCKRTVFFNIFSVSNLTLYWYIVKEACLVSVRKRNLYVNLFQFISHHKHFITNEAAIFSANVQLMRIKNEMRANGLPCRTPSVQTLWRLSALRRTLMKL